MTEAELLKCTDPRPMLEFRRGKASDRKFRLLAVACCQRVRHLLHSESWRKGVDVANHLTDGVVPDEVYDPLFAQLCDQYEEYGVDPFYEEYADYGGPSDSEEATQPEQANAALATLCAIVRYEADDGSSQSGRAYPYDSTSIAAKAAARAVAYAVTKTAANPARKWDEVRQQETIAQAALLRDIFVNPFRSVAVDPSWLAWNNATVVRVAQGVYEGRAFDRLPVLADAIEDAGCTNPDILDHCREPGEHVRGCWVVDLLLGKE